MVEKKIGEEANPVLERECNDACGEPDRAGKNRHQGKAKLCGSIRRRGGSNPVCAQCRQRCALPGERIVIRTGPIFVVHWHLVARIVSSFQRLH